MKKKKESDQTVTNNRTIVHVFDVSLEDIILLCGFYSVPS